MADNENAPASALEELSSDDDVHVRRAVALNVGPVPNAETVYSPALAGYGATPQLISWGPSSNHAGGLVVHLAVDGSAHNITTDCDPSVYIQLITRSGREPEVMAPDLED